MASVFWVSRERNQLLLLAAGIITVIAATAYAQIRLNAWNQPFYDALTRKDPSAFIAQLGVFAKLALALLFLNVLQVWFTQTSRVVLRQCLVHDLLDEWLKPGRAFRLSNAGSIGVNPDQRLHADAQHLTDLVTDLLVGLLQSTFLLLTFVGVLWVLSERMILPFGGQQLRIPGYMVWCALLYAIVASLLSWRVGRPLVALNAERYAREADLRFSLVRASEEIEGVTIYDGEAGEKQVLHRAFESVVEVSRRIARAMARLTWITAGYGWFTLVAPILVAAPAYLSGNMSFGELIMVVGAFNQVQASLRWFVDNASSLADWRATRRRVASFHSAVLSMDRLGESTDRIDLEETASDSIRIENLCIAAPAGSIRLSEPCVEFKPGARALIAGDHASDSALLFRAMIGIWPWGRGRIIRPPRTSIMFLPARAYVPAGTLRAVLSYPLAPDAYDQAITSAALSDVGLERLLQYLDTTERWDRRLNDDEKQSVAFARVILRRPQWLVMNGAFEDLDPASRQRIEAIFAGPLSGVSVIGIGHDSSRHTFFTHRLHLMTDPTGPTFRPDEQLAAASAQAAA
jgi:putative ATP-binding cassette transporter